MAKTVIQDERGFNQVFAPVGSAVLRGQRRSDWFTGQALRAGARRILEIGCGTGEMAARMATGNPEAEVIAVDISDMFLARARESYQAPNLRFEKLDLLGEDPFRLGRFDYVYGNGILHHLVVHLPEVLTALHRLSNPGGRLAFIEPNFANPYCAVIFGTGPGRRWARLEPDEMAFMPGELRRALATAGWRHPVVTTRDFLVPGLPTLLVKPVLAMEPLLEATRWTRWLAQSHFVTAEA